ncbi:MAG: hypothetical protein AB7P02_20805 [Alphaproteobacteria bacterium]
MAPGAPRRAVVVLGMHRSGTSLLASLLQTLGVDLGGDLLLDRRPDNENGYWEHAGIAAAQEALLDRLGRRWYGPEGLLPLPAGWWRLPEVAPCRRELAAIVDRETAAAVGVWGFKDPRTVRLLPLWSEIFAALGVTPTYVLALRDPAAVAASLARRDAMSPAAAQLLWLQHTLDAFRHAGDRIAAVVDYDDWFAAPVDVARGIMARLDLTWAADDAALREALSALVRPELRHARAGGADRLMPEVRELYGLLRAAAPDAPPAAAVAGLLARFDDAHRLMAAWGELAAAIPRHRAALDEANAEIAGLRAAAESERAALEARIAAGEERAAAYERDHATMQRLYAELDGRRIAAETEAARTHEALAATVADRDARLAAGAAEHAALAAESQARQRIVDAVMPDPARALDEVWNSTSLRLTRPLQRLIGGRAAIERPAPATADEQARAVVRLQDTFFWEMTGPLRAVARLLRRGRNR